MKTILWMHLQSQLQLPLSAQPPTEARGAAWRSDIFADGEIYYFDAS